MQKYYFTYSIGGHPFYGGWTEIVAPDMETAVATFRKHRPDKIEGLLNCACIYEQQHFEGSFMHKYGNFEQFCHERITVAKVRRRSWL